MKKFLLALPIFGALFVGCNSSSSTTVSNNDVVSSSSSNSSTNNVVENRRVDLVLNVPTKINDGDTLFKANDDALIQIAHNLDSNERTVTLTNGEAYIIRAN